MDAASREMRRDRETIRSQEVHRHAQCRGARTTRRNDQERQGRRAETVEGALRNELTGILNWALDGLARLTANGGRFTRVPSADEAIQTLRDLASPVAAFVREECVVAQDRSVKRETLYSAYRAWADSGGYPKSPKHVFGRDLHAAVPSIKATRSKDGSRHYAGTDFLVDRHSSDTTA